MSLIIPRVIRGTRGIRLNGLGFAASPTLTIQAQQIQQSQAQPTYMPLLTSPSVDAVVASMQSREQAYADTLRNVVNFANMGGDPVPPPPVVETTGEVIQEQRAPLPGEQPAAPPAYVSAIAVSRRPAWQVWLPVGVAVLGIGAAVLILRKK